MGTTVLSKSFNCRSIGIYRLFILVKRRNMAFLACCTTCFLAPKKLPDCENRTPRYLYESTISSSSLANLKLMFDLPRVPKINILVYPILIVSFHCLQYSENACKQFWRSVGLSAIITVSSAYRSENSLRYNSTSPSVMSVVIPDRFLCKRYDSKSFRYSAERMGDTSFHFGHLLQVSK